MSLDFEKFDFTATRDLYKAAEPKSPGLLGNVADTGLQLAQGVLQGGEMLANTFGADNPLSQRLRQGSEWLASNFSDQLKWEQLTSAQDMKAAELSGSTWEEIKSAARSFGRDPVGYLANAAGTTLPTIAAAFLPGGQGALLGRLAAVSMGSAQGAGAVKGQIYSEVEKAWKEAGASDEEAEARAAAAQAYLGSNSGQIILGAALGGIAGGTGAEAGILARRAGGMGADVAADAAATTGASIFGRAAAKVPRVFREGVKEALPEAAQGGQEALAGNLALQNEGFDVSTWGGVASSATLEGLAGGAFGAATSPFTRPPVPQGGDAPPAAPAAPDLSDPDQAMREIGRASSVDEAIDAANRVASTSLTPQDEDRALSIMERTAKADADAVKFGPGGRMPTPSLAGGPALGPDGLPVEPTAEVTDMPFADRVLTLREQLADPRVREQLRELGQEAFDTVTYYASVADNTDVDLPQKTRERLLSLAEGVLSRAVLRPVDRPGVEGPSDPAATLPLEGPGPGPARIGLDTTETGTIRVDGEGRAAPETRADAINTQRSTLRERVDGMTQQVDRRPLPRDFTLVGEGEMTTPARRERTEPADQAQPDTGTMLLTADGFPYGTRSGAVIRARREGLGSENVVEVEGGFAVRTAETEDVAVPDVAGTPESVVGPADGRGDNAGGSLGDVRPDPAGQGGLGGPAAASGGRVAAPGVVGDAGDAGGALTESSGQRVPPKAEDFKDAASYFAAMRAFRAANPVTPASNPATQADKQVTRRAEIKRELSALQDRYEKRMRRNDGLSPPAIKADALAGIARQMDRLKAELQELDAGSPIRAATPPANEGPTTEGARDGQGLQEEGRGRQEVAPVDPPRASSPEPAADLDESGLDQSQRQFLFDRGFEDNGPRPREWVMPISNLGDVVAKVVSKPGEPIRAEISADYMGKRLGTRVAEGPAAIDEAIKTARDGINAGRDKLARQFAADERGLPGDQAPKSLTDRVQRLRKAAPTRTEGDTPQTDAADATPRELIELRKREVVLKKLLDCMRE